MKEELRSETDIPTSNSAHKEHQRAASAAAGSLGETVAADNVNCCDIKFNLTLAAKRG